MTSNRNYEKTKKSKRLYSYEEWNEKKERKK